MTVTEIDSTAVIRVAGELDMASARQLTTTVGRVELDRVSLLILDLQEVEFPVLEPLGPAGRVFAHCGAR